MTPQAYVRLEQETLKVEADGATLTRVPLHHLGAVVLFGTAAISRQAMEKCAEDGREVTMLDFAGRFRCRVEGPVSGNVLLRKAQYDAHADEARAAAIARAVVAGRIEMRGRRSNGAARESSKTRRRAPRSSAVWKGWRAQVTALPGAANWK